MLILEKPNFPPYVCITCGVGGGRRWFVSLNDFPLDNYFNPLHDGVIFQCNECWESLATRVAKEAQVYLLGVEPWNTGEYVEPKYENKSALIEETSFGRISDKPTPELSGVSTIHSGTTEPDNPVPDSSESQPSTTDDDADAGPVSEFRVFFGGDDGERS
jgi:hypothetical protein